MNEESRNEFTAVSPRYWTCFAGKKGRKIEITAGSESIWEFHFVCGSRPIKSGGLIKIFCEVPKFWLGINLQSVDEKANWYCRAFGDVPVKIIQLQEFYKHLCWVTMELAEGAEEGQEVVFTCGVEVKPVYAIAHQYKNALVSMAVDYECNDEYTKLWPPIVIDVLPGDIAKLNIVVPSIVKPEEKFDIKVRGEDASSNIGAGAGKKVKVLLTDGSECKEAELVLEESGTVIWRDVLLASPGVYRVEARLEGSDEITAQSNPLICGEDTSLPGIYWGDCHCHSGWSDGVGTFEENIIFARDKAFLDIFGFAEHLLTKKDYTTGPEGKSGSDWAYLGPTMANMLNGSNNSKFATIMGFEFSPNFKGIEQPTGDHCLFTSGSDWKDIPMARELPDFLSLARDSGCLVIPHVGGSFINWDDAAYCPETTPLVEIASMHGRFEAFAQKGLQKGYKMGFCGMSDGHFGCPGYDCWALHGRKEDLAQRNYSVQSALTAFMMDGLSREAAFDAMKNRRTYATTGERIILTMNFNGHPMGDEFKTSVKPKLNAKYMELLRYHELIL